MAWTTPATGQQQQDRLAIARQAALAHPGELQFSGGYPGDEFTIALRLPRRSGRRPASGVTTMTRPSVCRPSV